MSFAPETEKIVEQLIQAEYKNARDNFGWKYHSLHEGYAVLLEEVEEVENYFDNVKTGLNNLWIGIKSNNQKIINGEQDEMLFDVQNAIKELAQVGAVLMKIQNTIFDEVEE